MDKNLRLLNPSYLINVIAQAGNSGYFLTGLVYKYVTHGAAAIKNNYNEYSVGDFPPIVRQWHYNDFDNDFGSIESHNVTVDEFLAPSRNIFITCYDRETACFTNFCNILKHEELDYHFLKEEHSLYADDHNASRMDLLHYKKTNDLAERMMKINPKQNYIFDYKKLVMEADSNSVDEFCRLINSDHYTSNVQKDILEYHSKNLDLIEKHRQILINKRNS